MNDPFPPKILVVCTSGNEATCLFKDVIDGIPRYELPWFVTEFQTVEKVAGNRLAADKMEHFDKDASDRLTADTNRALDLIGKALEP